MGKGGLERWAKVGWLGGSKGRRRKGMERWAKVGRGGWKGEETVGEGG